MQQLLIIIATYNEIDNIQPLLQEIFAFATTAHVLVIDDNSPDGTHQLVKDLSMHEYKEKLFLIKRSHKLGLGSAYVAGFKWALEMNYQFILHMDADFSHNPKYLPAFLEQIQTNDLVIGSRYINGGGVKNWGLIRKVVSIGGSIYARFILKMIVRDLTGGFKCFRRDVLNTIGIDQLKSNGYSFQIETTYKSYLHGFKIKEIPITFEDRRVGQSKMSMRIFFEAFYMVVALRWRGK